MLKNISQVGCLKNFCQDYDLLKIQKWLFSLKLHLFVYETNYIPIESMKPIDMQTLGCLFFPVITIGLTGINR